MAMDFELLWMLCEHLLLTALPGVAAVILATRLGLRNVSLLLAIALAASGVVAFLSFWLYYANPTLGQTGSFFLILGSLLLIIWHIRNGGQLAPLRPLAVPVALWVLASAFVLFLGFLHGGTSEPLLTAANRFSHPLPGDNELPRYFAEYFYLHGHHGSPPPYASWLSSDRPPLQIGYVLAQRPFGWDGAGLHYQVLGVVIQQLWVLGLWALLCAARLTPRVRSLVALAAIVSDIAIVHAFFVWPKLITVGFLFAALAIVLSPHWGRWRREPLVAVLFAGLCGAAMLAHGSSVFFIFPLLVLMAVRGLPSLRWIFTGFAVGVVLLGSWSAYQHYADPPGNRLIKWQLAGSVAVDKRGAAETIVDSYREAGLNGTLENKWGNVKTIVGLEPTEAAVGEAVDEASGGHFGMAIRALRVARFFYLGSFLGLLLLGPIVMLVARARGRRNGPDWEFAVTALGLWVLACIGWALLLFGGEQASTMIHQGSLAVPLLAVCACVAGACAAYPRFGLGLTLTNVALVLMLYVPVLTPPAHSSYSPTSAVLAAAALAGIVWITLRPLKQDQVPGNRDVETLASEEDPSHDLVRAVLAPGARRTDF